MGDKFRMMGTTPQCCKLVSNQKVQNTYTSKTDRGGGPDCLSLMHLCCLWPKCMYMCWLKHSEIASTKVCMRHSYVPKSRYVLKLSLPGT